ncbi:MAG: transglutaminase domain-containing protein [Bacteroides sp.]|nr:transglutaminase domain-containing protein [Bacteroides sp.]
MIQRLLPVGCLLLLPLALNTPARAFTPKEGTRLDRVKDYVATPEQIRTLEWLYDNMPPSDAAGYPEEFFADNVRLAFETRDLVPWGHKVPEREFLHFVVPPRVNNESLDSARRVFREELLPRIQGMSMADAILEVNHWCHEKVTYQPSDGRTSSPLSAVSQAIGRCGEESTFTVAALRSVGIPARQVYTPRWAHTDDNHAWVEAWADGEWHFLGACEPAPVLDMAWFNAPASRGMLMTTRVSGSYDGPEEVVSRDPAVTVINVTSNYAPTSPATVRVVDEAGVPVEGARVDFRLYNYAEYYPLSTRTSDVSGHASLDAGLGDLVVSATDGVRFGMAHLKAGEPADVVLHTPASLPRRYEWTITPPPQSATLPSPAPEAVALNDARLAREDSVRAAYVATFASPRQYDVLAARLGIDPDRLGRLMVLSRGNHRALASMLSAITLDEAEPMMGMLESVSEKDLRDADSVVLLDHLRNTPADDSLSPEVWTKYVLNPRLSSEPLVAWRSALGAMLSPEEKAALRSAPDGVGAMVGARISRVDGRGARGTTFRPDSAWRLGKADNASLPILAAALLRTAGVPARVNPVDGAPQWLSPEGGWSNIVIPGGAADDADSADSFVLKIRYEDNGLVHEPKYYRHFSLSRLDGGVPQLMELDDFITPEGINGGEFVLESGRYLLTSGQRLADGSVLARTEVLDLSAASPEITLTIPCNESEIQVIGSFDSESLYRPLDEKELRNILSTTGRGYYTLIVAAPSHEPTAHVLNDLIEVREALEADGRAILVVFPDEEAAARFDRSAYTALPSNVSWGVDTTGAITGALRDELRLDPSQLPLLIVADTFNRVVYAAQGYTIGTGETLLHLLSRLR